MSSFLEFTLIFVVLMVPSILSAFVYSIDRKKRSFGSIRIYAMIALLLELVLGVVATVLIYCANRYYQNGGHGEFWLLMFPASIVSLLFFGFLPASVTISLLCGRDFHIIKPTPFAYFLGTFFSLYLGSFYFRSYSYNPIIIMCIVGVAFSAILFRRIFFASPPPIPSFTPVFTKSNRNA